MSRFDDNITYDATGATSCAHCAATLAAPGEPHLHRALIRTGEISLAGPHVQTATPPVVNEDVQFRQLLCPSCATALMTEIAATTDHQTRTGSLLRKE